jgi:hypothetical protein
MIMGPLVGRQINAKILLSDNKHSVSMNEKLNGQKLIRIISENIAFITLFPLYCNKST